MTEEDKEDNVTNSENTRWIGLSTYISVTLVSSFILSILAHAGGVIDLSTLPEIAYTVYIGLVFAACYYALGDDAVDAGTEVTEE